LDNLGKLAVKQILKVYNWANIKGIQENLEEGSSRDLVIPVLWITEMRLKACRFSLGKGGSRMDIIFR